MPLLPLTIRFNRILFIVLITAFNLTIEAQQQLIVGLSENGTFSVELNSAFIKTHKMKSVTKHVSNKPDNEVIIDKGQVEYFEFNSNGNLVYSFSTFIKASEDKDKEIASSPRSAQTKHVPYYKKEYSYLYDTLFTYYAYDTQNRLIIKRVSLIGKEVFKCYYYEYDTENRVKKETIVREVNAAENLMEYKVGMQTVLSMESYTYTKVSPTKFVKHFFNDEGKIYKEGEVELSTRGAVLQESFNYVVTWIKEFNTYKYNSKNLIIEKNMISNDGFASHETYDYDPDAVELFNGLHIYKDGIKLKDISYIFNKEKGILESEVCRDHKKASIGITKYEYEYYP